MKIFLSYSHEDIDVCKRLEGVLRLQERDGGQIWRDDQISPGCEWDAVIAENLRNSQIIVFLISPAFLESNYIPPNELAPALHRQQTGTARLVPILLQRCDWKVRSGLGDLQALPSGGKPISHWPYETDAMLNIAAGMRKVAFELAAQMSLDQANRAILTLVELARNDPHILASILTCRNQFLAYARQIPLVLHCKAVHEILHLTRFECAIPLRSLLPRFPQEPSAYIEATRYDVKLQGKMEELSGIAEKCEDPVAKIRTDPDVSVILRYFRQVSAGVHKAIEKEDRILLDNSLKPMGSLLTQFLPRFATRLDLALEALGLDDLVQSIATIFVQVQSHGIDPIDQARIEASLRALKSLKDRLTTLKEEHKSWQAIDIEFSLAESPTLSFNEFSVFWPGLNASLTKLCQGREEQWATALQDQVAKLNMDKDDMIKVQRLFPSLLQRGGDRFLKVDHELKSVAEDLSKLDDPFKDIGGIKH